MSGVGGEDLARSFRGQDDVNEKADSRRADPDANRFSAMIEHCPFERAEKVTAEFAGGAEQERSADHVERVAGCPLASKQSSHRRKPSDGNR